MAVNWGIGLDMPDAGQAFTKGLEKGIQTNALSALVRDPTNQGAINALAQVDPATAYRFAEQNRKVQLDQRAQEARRAAVTGQPGALPDLAAVDWDAYQNLDEATRKRAGEAVDFIGQAALQIDSLPEEARGQAWSEYVRIAESRGMDIPPAYEQYSPAVLSATLAESKQVKEALEGRQPKYQVIPEGGTLVNTRDPAALAQVAGQNAAPPAAQDTSAIPPPPPGFQIDGGPTPTASGNFPGPHR